MDVDELFRHTLGCLPEAVGDLLRARQDPDRFVFASFDGASELGKALLCSDLTSHVGLDARSARADVERLVASASLRGEELVVSLMLTRTVLHRLLAVADLDAKTRISIRIWLDGPLEPQHYRVVAIAGDRVRAALVDAGVTEDDAPPISQSMLN
jgi:hypothetical protein